MVSERVQQIGSSDRRSRNFVVQREQQQKIRRGYANYLDRQYELLRKFDFQLQVAEKDRFPEIIGSSRQREKQQSYFRKQITNLWHRGFCSKLQQQNQCPGEEEKHIEKFFSMTMDQFDIQGALELSSRLEDKFASLSNSTSQGVWYIDNEASTHMTRVRKYLSSYKEQQMDFEIMIGN